MGGLGRLMHTNCACAKMFNAARDHMPCKKYRNQNVLFVCVLLVCMLNFVHFDVFINWFQKGSFFFFFKSCVIISQLLVGLLLRLINF